MNREVSGTGGLHKYRHWAGLVSPEDCESLGGCPDDVADALNESKRIANERDESGRLL